MKFRVYDKQAGEYITGDSLFYSGLNTKGEFCYIDNNAELHPYVQNLYTVEQFTGFTDKNGREIYEGDLARDKSNHENIRKICWNKQMGQWFWGDFILCIELENLEVTGTAHDANCSEMEINS